MNKQTKVVRVGQGPCGNVYVKIELTDGKLSITGVEGPMSNGNAEGGCGQINMHEWKISAYAFGWTREMEVKLREIWGRWHLNDTVSCSPAMREAGWLELAKTPIYKWDFCYYGNAKRDAERAVLDAARAGQTFTPTAEQVAALNLPLGYVEYTYQPTLPKVREGYGLFSGREGRPERTSLGWVKPSDHPDGLLTKVLTPDEPGYGCRWWKEEVPQEVIDWLFSLPDTDRTPAWV